MVFPRRRLACTIAVLGACATAVPVAAQTDGDVALRPCSALEIPAKPPERVWCTTPNATLSIAHQSDPILLDGTEVRVLSAERSGSAIRVRTRVRNTTRAEQGLSAGGQELYLWIDGSRVDLAVFREVHFGVGEAKTIQLDFELTPAQLSALDARGGRLDFGVRPWHNGVLPAPLVGVLRVGVGG